MKKSLGVLGVVLILISFISIDNASGLQGADFAIYTGPGTWEPSITAFENFLNWKGLTWEEIGKNDVNDGSFLGLYSSFYMPGGWAGDYNKHIRSSGDQNIRDFISNGGSYYGVSAGAFYACDHTIWEGNNYNYPSNIFGGDCIGPIDEIAPWPNYVMTTVNMNLNHPANVYEPAQRDGMYYGEGWFEPYPGQEMQVFANWIVPSNPQADGTPAMIGFNYGQGRVVLTGPHFEIEEDDTRDGTNFGEELSDGPDGSDWPLLWTTVDWMRQVPITLPPGSTQPECNDGLDNDGDFLVDFPADPGCTSAGDDDETDPTPPKQCEDGIDNDGDGFADFGNDFGCSSETDDDEVNNGNTQCSNGLDDDFDGFIDESDLGCLTWDDNDETDPTGPQAVFEDGFESGTLNSWFTYGAGRPWEAKTDVPNTGNWVARAKRTGAGDDSFMETSFDASVYSIVTFEYYRKLISLDAADDWEVQYFDSGSWTSVEHLGSSNENNANFVFKSFSIPNTASKVRFKCEVGAVSEKCYVDDVKILGE
jgi:hypothetical protein